MAQLGNFNPDAVEDKFQNLPAHTCMAQVIESDLQAKERGQTLMVKYELMDGPHAKRQATQFMQIQHENVQAQEIAQRDLKRLCAAVGHQGVLSDSEQLHFKPFMLTLGERPSKDPQYGPNQTFRYASIGGGTVQPMQPAQTGAYQPPQQQAATGGNRPWK